MTTEEQLKGWEVWLDDVLHISGLPHDDEDVPGMALMLRDSLRVAQGALAELAVGVPKPTREGRAAARLQARIDRARIAQVAIWHHAEAIALGKYLAQHLTVIQNGGQVDGDEEPLWAVWEHVVFDTYEGELGASVFPTYCDVVTAIHPVEVEQLVTSYAESVGEAQVWQDKRKGRKP